MYTIFKKKQHNILIIAFLVSILSCDSPKVAFEKIFISPVPVNFSTVNSGYDDYNSAGPRYDITHEKFRFYFSSNRYTNGNSFDIVQSECYAVFNHNYASFNIWSDLDYYEYSSPKSYTSRLVFDPDSIYNELGPYFYNDSTLIFACDSSGNLDLVYYETQRKNYNYLDRLNSAYNDAYLTLHRKNKKLYFCSDSLGRYDIYRCNNVVEDATRILQKELVGALNSNYNDKCPYIIDSILVFTSDREHGYGGFDLYYSIYNGEEWSEPVNFGPEINSEYDEYRPILMKTNPEVCFNELMVFSSDRPGGEGGFDLYYVGVEF